MGAIGQHLHMHLMVSRDVPMSRYDDSYGLSTVDTTENLFDRGYGV